MPWDGSPEAGFTTGEPWLPLNPDWRTRNVEALSADPGSILNLYRRLIAVRRSSRALQLGDYRELVAADGVLAYERRLGDESVIVVLNLTGETKTASIPEAAGRRIATSAVTAGPGAAVSETLTLPPNEGLVLA
jgi:glycosidase